MNASTWATSAIMPDYQETTPEHPPNVKGLDLKLTHGITGRSVRVFLEYPDQEKPLEDQMDLYTRLVAMAILCFKHVFNETLTDEMVIGYWDDEDEYINLGSWPELVHAIKLMGDNPFKVVLYASVEDSPRWRSIGDYSILKSNELRVIMAHHKVNVRVTAPTDKGKDFMLVGCELLVSKPIPKEVQALLSPARAKDLAEEEEEEKREYVLRKVFERTYNPYLLLKKKKYIALRWEEKEEEGEPKEDVNFQIVHNDKAISKILYDCDMPEFAPELPESSAMAFSIGIRRFCYDTGALKDDVIHFYQDDSQILFHCYSKVLALPKNRIGILHFKSTVDVGCYTWNVFPNVTNLVAFARHLTAKPTFVIVCLAHKRAYLRYYPVGCFGCPDEPEWSKHGIVSFYQLPEKWHRLEKKYGEGNVRLGFNGSADPVFYLRLEVRKKKEEEDESSEEEEEEEEQEQEQEDQRIGSYHCNSGTFPSRLLTDIIVNRKGVIFDCHTERYRLPKSFIGVLHLDETSDWEWCTFPKIKQAKVYARNLLVNTDSVLLFVHCIDLDNNGNGELFIRNFHSFINSPSDNWETKTTANRFNLVVTWKHLEEKFGKGNVRFDFAPIECLGFTLEVNHPTTTTTTTKPQEEESQSKPETPKDKEKQICNKWVCFADKTSVRCTRKCKICQEHVYQLVDVDDKRILDEYKERRGFIIPFKGGFVHEYCLRMRYGKKESDFDEQQILIEKMEEKEKEEEDHDCRYN